MVCVSHKAADHTNAMGLRGDIHERGDILNDRAVALKSVIGAVKTANRANDTANVIDLGVHDHIAVDGEVLDRTGSDLAEEAQARSAAFHVEPPDGVVLSVKDTAEIIAVCACKADGCPKSVFKVDIRSQKAFDLSVAVYVDLLCKPEELTGVRDLVVAVVVRICGRLICATYGAEAFFIVSVRYRLIAVGFAAILALCFFGTSDASS